MSYRIKNLCVLLGRIAGEVIEFPGGATFTMDFLFEVIAVTRR